MPLPNGILFFLGGKRAESEIQLKWPSSARFLERVIVMPVRASAMKKLEESLDFLQRQEEKLWFWGVDRAEDMGFSAEFLRQAGLNLDRRIEFPRKAANLALAPERAVPAFVLGPVRRGLAESMEAPRAASFGD